jgi:TetR/AcrR family transcriptional regulator, lmrAB and yxaGH operons repressor
MHKGRTYGFEGVSLKQLARQPASKRRVCTGGKDEIALAVTKNVIEWFKEKVFRPLSGASPARKRIATAAGHLQRFSLNGTKSCLTDVLSLPGGSLE